jgi:uncharacterized metal-binding protein YceD (DUF177 family)
MSDSEFSRTVRADTIGAEPKHIHVEADDAERAALARRFGLVAIDRLEADVELSQPHSDMVASGRIRAAVGQSCVATGEPVHTQIDEPFTVRFRPPPTVGGGVEDEIELGEDEMDVIFFDAGDVDVGEAVAQTLALHLDPYPRSPDAETALKQAGVKDEGEAGPFGALAALKDKLEKE